MVNDDTKQAALAVIALVTVVFVGVAGGLQCERIAADAVVECSKTHPPLECQAAIRGRR